MKSDITLGNIYRDKENGFVRIAGFISDISKPYDKINNPLLCVLEKLFILDNSVCSDPGNYKYCTAEYLESNYELYMNINEVKESNRDSIEKKLLFDMKNRGYIPLTECC